VNLKNRTALREMGFLPGAKSGMWTQFDADIPDLSAVQALHRGDANADQQRRAVEWILKQLAQVQVSTFHLDPAASAFAEGRRYVGLKLAQAINISMRDMLANEG
jgi:hypothetical protein